jgi:hypothetical protein
MNEVGFYQANSLTESADNAAAGYISDKVEYFTWLALSCADPAASYDVRALSLAKRNQLLAEQAQAAPSQPSLASGFDLAA